MTDKNELVWQGTYGLGFNFGVQTYQDRSVLAYWNGTGFPESVGRGYGFIYLLDASYEEIADVSFSGNFKTTTNETYPSNIDLHEVYITNRDTTLVTANNVMQTDLRSVGGPENGWVVDGQVYEIGIETNKVVFRWSGLDHLAELPLNTSLYPLGSEGFNGASPATARGYFHINAIARYEDGYIVSSRLMCSAIAIDRNGNLKWWLQGRHEADFILGKGTNFCYQHDVRAVNISFTALTIHMHDNDNCPIDNGTTPSSVLFLDVDLKAKKVDLQQRLLNSKQLIYSTAQGNLQSGLEKGHIFVGYGF